MEQLTELKNAIVERFKLNAYIKEIENIMAHRAKTFTFKKYKGTVILREGLEYELFAVNAHCVTWSTSIIPCDINLALTYTIISQINPPQKKALSKAKDRYNEDNHMGCYEGKKRLWIEEYYVVEPEIAMSGKIILSKRAKLSN